MRGENLQHSEQRLGDSPHAAAGAAWAVEKCASMNTSGPGKDGGLNREA